ncbi:60S ribosomal protein L10a-2, partial [Sarracenia purpurea var. burkii]
MDLGMVYWVRVSKHHTFVPFKTSGHKGSAFQLSAQNKLQSDAVREAISQIAGDAKEKKCNIVETIELQIRLKNYDPQKDKRFSGSMKLPHIPRPKIKVGMLGDAQHVEE